MRRVDDDGSVASVFFGAVHGGVGHVDESVHAIGFVFNQGGHSHADVNRNALPFVTEGVMAHQPGRTSRIAKPS